jgi:hypothetical protein
MTMPRSFRSLHAQTCGGARLLLTCSSLLLSLGLLGCGAQSAERQSTNTGNPPVIDDGEIRVELSGDGVLVRGLPGAVSPGGAKVVVQNEDSDETASTHAAEDGSFAVELDGTLQDDFRVSVDGGKASVELPGEALPGEAPITSVASSESVEAGPLLDTSQYTCIAAEGIEVSVGASASGDAVCSFLNAEAACREGQAIVDADNTCTQDSDCVEVGRGASCTDHCGWSIRSKAGAAEIRQAVNEIDSELCADFAAQDCNYIPSGCPAPSDFEPACRDGQCTFRTGCELVEQQADLELQEAAPALAKGCATDDDCSVQRPAPCSWLCGTRLVPVASANRTQYTELLSSLEDTCNLAGECSGLPCTTDDPPAAMCDEGECVALTVERGLEQNIEAELEQLNHCEVAEDCVAIDYPMCQKSFIAADSEREQLDTWLDSYNATPVPCDAVCSCAVVQCVEQRCSALPVDCSPDAGALSVCL